MNHAHGLESARGDWSGPYHPPRALVKARAVTPLCFTPLISRIFRLDFSPGSNGLRTGRLSFPATGGWRPRGALSLRRWAVRNGRCSSS